MNKSINEVKKYLSSININDIPKSIDEFKNDKRKGIQNIINHYNKKYNNYIKEIDRINCLWEYENSCCENNTELVAGIDEVGRGPLAGPVTAAAVILPRNCKIMYINDSKKLSKKKREILFDDIKEQAISIGIGIVPNCIIDEINILQATFEAMKIAIDNLNVKPQFIIIDGNMKIPNIAIPQKDIIKGDCKTISIAAASIIAKVTRDRIMTSYSQIYPEYYFEKNSGYGSQQHINAIEKYGVCPIHRKTFNKVKQFF